MVMCGVVHVMMVWCDDDACGGDVCDDKRGHIRRGDGMLWSKYVHTACMGVDIYMGEVRGYLYAWSRGSR